MTGEQRKLLGDATTAIELAVWGTSEDVSVEEADMWYASNKLLSAIMKQMLGIDGLSAFNELTLDELFDIYKRVYIRNIYPKCTVCEFGFGRNGCGYNPGPLQSFPIDGFACSKFTMSEDEFSTS